MAYQDSIALTNDAVGNSFREEIWWVAPVLNDTSAHGNSAGNMAIGPAVNFSGRVVDFGIFVTKQAVSASGFMSGTIDALVRLNSASITSTNPTIPMVSGSATQQAAVATYVSGGFNGGTSCVINNNSAVFSPGNYISFDYNARSVGSGAAAAAGTGLRVYVKIRRFSA
jgi:hypothetical protein